MAAARRLQPGLITDAPGYPARVAAPTIRQVFAPSPANVARARMLVRSAHATLPPNLRGPVEVVVSELASNAVRHAATPFQVSVSIGSTVRVEVTDGSPGPPILRKAGPAEPAGRGLLIVEAYAD